MNFFPILFLLFYFLVLTLSAQKKTGTKISYSHPFPFSPSFSSPLFQCSDIRFSFFSTLSTFSASLYNFTGLVEVEIILVSKASNLNQEISSPLALSVENHNSLLFHLISIQFQLPLPHLENPFSWSLNLSNNQSLNLYWFSDQSEKSIYQFKFRFRGKNCENKIIEIFICYYISNGYKNEMCRRRGFLKLPKDCLNNKRLMVRSRGEWRMRMKMKMSVEKGEKNLENIKVDLSFKKYTCVYWNKSLSSWDDYGCKSLNMSISSFSCHCTHLSIFNTLVDFRLKKINLTTTIVDITRYSKPYVLYSLATMWLIYGLLCLIAKYYDQIDFYKSLPIDLSDNDPNARYLYLIIVLTGRRFLAGTKSGVYIQLIGKNSKSNANLLRCRRFKVLKRGDRNSFIIRTLVDLGDLTEARVWVGGKNDNWYLKKIIAIDLQKKKSCQFLCESWLSPGNFCYRTLPAATYDELYQFKPLMQNNAYRFFEENHTWLSIFLTPMGSNFTRVQRLSRAFCMFLGNLGATLMFFDEEIKEQLFRIGFIQLTYLNLNITVYNFIMITPIIAASTFFFRNSETALPDYFFIPDWRDKKNMDDKPIDVEKILEKLNQFNSKWNENIEDFKNINTNQRKKEEEESEKLKSEKKV